MVPNRAPNDDVEEQAAVEEKDMEDEEEEEDEEEDEEEYEVETIVAKVLKRGVPHYVHDTEMPFELRRKLKGLVAATA